MSRAQAHAPVSAAERAALDRAADAARQSGLYGDAVDDVAYLRKRGFVVNRDGDGVRVGNRLLSLDAVRAMAARERGLAGDAPSDVRRPAATAGGLAVGQAVALVPKPVRAAPVARARAPRQRPGEDRQSKPLQGAARLAREKAAEYSSDLGPRPRVVWLDLKLLVVDGKYQRDVTAVGQTHVNRLRQGWNWNCYQPLIVAERADGTYAVIDGQHRLLAATGHPLIDELPCYIVDAPDVAAQAAIFTAVNSRRLSLTSQQKFWSAHAAGDATIVAVEKLCSKVGVTILRSPPSGDIPPRSILAPFTLQKLHKLCGAPALESSLGLLAETHGETVNGFRSPTIVGLTRIAAATPFSRARMARALKRIDLDDLHDEAKVDRAGRGGSLEQAMERLLRVHYKRAG